MRCALQWKLSVNTAGYSMLSRALSSELHLQATVSLCSDTVACYKADHVRYTLKASGFCWTDLQRDRMGRDKDAHPCLNASAFFGGGTHLLVFGTAAAEWWEAGGDQNKSAPPGLLSASSQGHREILNEPKKSWLVRNCFIFTSTLGSSCPFPQSCPQMRSSPPIWVTTDKLNKSDKKCLSAVQLDILQKRNAIQKCNVFQGQWGLHMPSTNIFF